LEIKIAGEQKVYREKCETYGRNSERIPPVPCRIHPEIHIIMQNNGKINGLYENFQHYPLSQVDSEAQNKQPEDDGITEKFMGKKRPD
jgi:hypothetical protein